MTDKDGDLRRTSFYALYRTLYVEDVAFEAGQACADLYLTRSFNAKDKSLSDRKAMIELKEAHLKLLTPRLLAWARNALAAGAGNAVVKTKATQKLTTQKRAYQVLLKMKQAYEAEKIRIDALGTKTTKIVTDHAKAMKFYRKYAYNKRVDTERTGYLGTATPD